MFFTALYYNGSLYTCVDTERIVDSWGMYLYCITKLISIVIFYLNRWNIAFDSLKEYPSSPSMNPSSDSIANSPEDDPINMLVMNNYFGIGVDAVLALEFHLAREEAPSKFNSR